MHIKYIKLYITNSIQKRRPPQEAAFYLPN